MMGWGNQGYGMWGMGGFGWIVMILFWGVVQTGRFRGKVIRRESTGKNP